MIAPHLLSLLLRLTLVASSADPSDRLERFWGASGPEAREKLVAELLALDLPFKDLAELVAGGPRHRPDVPRGRLLRVRVDGDGVKHPWLLLVPPEYRPERRYMLRVELHGGMGAPAWPHDGSWAPGWRPPPDHLVLLPAGWWDSMWWTRRQSENLAAILDEVKRTWNVDEYRILLVGSSDGCIGSCFYAFRDPTPFAGFGGSIGCPVRLTNPTLRIDGQMHLSNLAGTKFFLMNGGRDPLFPVKDIRDYWDLFRKHGADVRYLEYPEAGHGFALKREDEREWVCYLFETVRDPLPESISWATERTDRYARKSWVQILRLGKASSDATSLDQDIVMPRICTGKYRRLRAKKPRPWGRVDATRTGNRVDVTTRGVKRFRLLLGWREFDFDDAIEIRVNGKVVHDEIVSPDPACLLRWAARDLDRTMLFAAEVDVEVP